MDGGNVDHRAPHCFQEWVGLSNALKRGTHIRVDDVFSILVGCLDDGFVHLCGRVIHQRIKAVEIVAKACEQRGDLCALGNIDELEAIHFDVTVGFGAVGADHRPALGSEFPCCGAADATADTGNEDLAIAHRHNLTPVLEPEGFTAELRYQVVAASCG